MEIASDLFDHDYTNVTQVYDDGKDDTDLIAEKVFIQPFGWVKNLTNFNMSRIIEISAPQRLRIMLLDSLTSDRLRAKETETFVETEVSENKIFAYARYMVHYAVYDNRIHDGISCTDYKKIGTTYGKCVQREVRQQLLDWDECLPPWFPNAKLDQRRCR